VFVYVLFAAGQRTDHAGLRRFAEGPLAGLAMRNDPPEQPVRAFAAADGSPVRLSDFRGQVVLVNFWATWCAPCRQEMPSLAALDAAIEDPDFAVIPISIDDVAVKSEAEALLAELSGGTLPFYLDYTRGVALDAQAGLLPMSILYDRDGREVARLLGEADWASPQAVGLVRTVLERSAPVAEPPSVQG
jgi:thiol-disulfide isomerase/thioredoxin